MSRIKMGVYVALSLIIFSTSVVEAQTVQDSSNSQCKAPDKTHQYLGATASPYKLVIGNPSYTIINLSRQACSQTCPTGTGSTGKIPGLCALKDGKPVCQATAACNNQPIDKTGPGSQTTSPTATAPGSGSQPDTSGIGTSPSSPGAASTPSGTPSQSAPTETPPSSPPAGGSSGSGSGSGTQTPPSSPPSTYTPTMPLAAPTSPSSSELNFGSSNNQIVPNLSLLSQALNQLTGLNSSVPPTAPSQTPAQPAPPILNPYSTDTFAPSGNGTAPSTLPNLPTQNNNPQTISAPGTQPCATLCQAVQDGQKVAQWAAKNLNPISAAEAAPGPQFSLQSTDRVFELGFKTFVATAVERTQNTTRQTVTAIANGVGAAGYLSKQVNDSGLKSRLQSYVSHAQALKQTFNSCVPADQDPDQGLSLFQMGCLGGAMVGNTGRSLQQAAQDFAETGQGLVGDVRNYVSSNPTASAAPQQTPPPAGSPKIIAVPKVIAGSGLQPSPQETPPQQIPPTPTQAPASGTPSPTQSPSPLPPSRQPFSGPATVPTPVGKVVAQLPGADQMGPITHNGMPAAQAAKEIGTTYYTKELTNFNDSKCASGTCPNNQPGIAHRTWPLGSQVQVCNANNGKCAVATIIDRGPATWLTNRTIDANPALTNAIGLNGLNPATYKLLSVPGIAQTAQPTGVALAPCNNQGCAPPTPNAKVAAASVPGVTSVPNCSSAGGICATDPTTGASFACQGDQAACQGKLQQQVALSRLCASNPATCGSGAGTYTAKQSGTTQQQPVPRQIIPIRSAYGTMGKLAKNPNVPTVSGVSNQDLINRIRAAGVNVDDQSSNLSNYPHGKNQMTALTWHGDVLPGSKLAPYEAQQNRAGKAAAQAVLSEDGTLHIVAPLDAETFHAATMNKLGPGIEIAGADNGKEPTAAQIQSMKAITDIVMNQLGWEVGTHGQIEPSHREALEAGAATVNYVYQGTSPAAQAVYGITDANGNPVAGANGQPLTTTQAPGASGTLQFLTNPDGSIYIDPSNGQPVPVPTVQLTQDPTNPNQYNAPDNRPPQAAPANPWPPGTNGYPNRQYAPEYPQPTQIGQPSQTGGGAPSFPRIPAQPPQTPIAQQIQQPLPQPVMTQSIPPASPITPTGTTTPATPVVSIVANPSSVSAGHPSLISWSSVGAVSCAVGPQNSQLIGTSTNGTELSPALTATTVFIATCQTQASTTISASTTVLVQ